MLTLKNIGITYENGKVAVSDFNLDIKKGEIIGIVGESGSGKSTLIKSIVGGLPETTKIVGEVLFEGKNILSDKKFEKGRNITIVFQETRHTLNPIRKIGRQYIEYIRQHLKISKEEAETKAIENLRKTNLPSPENIMNSYPYQLSGGMCQRVGIAMAMTFNPKILLADEPTSALDVTTQAQIVPEILICDEATSALDVSIQKSIIELLKKIQRETNMSIIFICHDLALVQSLADEVMVMYLGHIVEKLKSKNLKLEAKHPYTHALIKSVLSLEKNNRLEILEGDIPSPILLKDECPFVNRCKSAIEVCKVKKPKMKRFDSEHEVMCHLEF